MAWARYGLEVPTAATHGPPGHERVPILKEPPALNRITARRLRSATVYVLIGALIGPAIGLLTGMLDGLPLAWPSLRGLVAGVAIGVTVGVGEEFLVPYASRRLSFGRLNLLRFGAYLLAMQGSLLVVNVIRIMLRDGVGIGDGTLLYLGDTFARDLVLTLAVSVIIIAVLQLRRLHHASELWKLVTGRYYYPKEVELVFLLVDLAGSTAIAEKLGHIGFSRFLRDLFADLSEPILAWRGRVYQHLGDGVIVSWTTEALENGAAVRCFFDMVDHLEVHRHHYEQRYGLMPRLRAGVHAGPVVATWVGEAKKELAYHGDTLNAAARIQDACKRLGVPVLVSERAVSGLTGSLGFGVRSVGDVALEGKQSPLALFAVGRETFAP